MAASVSYSSSRSSLRGPIQTCPSASGIPTDEQVVSDAQYTGGAPWSQASRRLTAGLLLAATATAFETLAVATILPAMVADLGSLELYGWAFTAFLLTNLITIAIAGGEIDRVGPPRPFALGIALFVAGLLLAGVAPSMGVVIVARALQGAGSGLLAATNSALVGLAYDSAARPRMLAWLSTAWVIPGLAGPALAGLIAEYAGWRWVFFGIIPLPLVAAALVLPVIRHLAQPRTASPSWEAFGNAGLLAASTVVFLAGLGQLPALIAAPLTLAGAAGVIWALRRHLRADALQGTPYLAAAFTIMGLLSIGFYGTEAFIPLLLTAVRGQSLVVGGLPLTTSAITWAAGAWILDRRSARSGHRQLIWLGLALIAAGIVGVIAGLRPEVSPLVVLVTWTVAGLGVGLVYATIQLVTLECTSPENVGRAVSALQLVHTAGITLATGIGGALVASLSRDGHVTPTSLAIHGALMLGAIVAAMAVTAMLPPAAEP